MTTTVAPWSKASATLPHSALWYSGRRGQVGRTDPEPPQSLEQVHAGRVLAGMDLRQRRRMPLGRPVVPDE